RGGSTGAGSGGGARSRQTVELGQGRPQRELPVRFGQEIQALPRTLRIDICAELPTKVSVIASEAKRSRPHIVPLRLLRRLRLLAMTREITSPSRAVPSPDRETLRPRGSAARSPGRSRRRRTDGPSVGWG